MEELKKCPFCGGEAEFKHNHQHFIDWSDDVDKYSVSCKKCGASVYKNVYNARFRKDTCEQELKDGANAVMRKWNMRTG